MFPSLGALGVQIRVIIYFKCECDDGFLICNLNSTKIELEKWEDVITPTKLGSPGAVPNFGFSNTKYSPKPTQEELIHYIENSGIIEQRRQQCYERCTNIK